MYAPVVSILFILAAFGALYGITDGLNPVAGVLMAGVFGLIGLNGLRGSGQPVQAQSTFQGGTQTMYSELESALIDQNTQLNRAMGMSSVEAAQSAKGQIDAAIEKARATGRYGLGPLGDWAISQSSGELASYLDRARAAGVTDSDIRVWWDLDEVERQAVILNDETAHMATFLSALDEAGDPAQAGDYCWQVHPYYDYREGAAVDDGLLDQLLPVELKDRVNRWMESYSDGFTAHKGHPIRGHSLPEGHLTMNSWIREMVRKDLL